MRNATHALAVVPLLVLALAGCSAQAEANTVKQSKPSPAASATATEPAAITLTESDLTIPGTYSTKKAARTYFERLESWLHAGETDENAARSVDVMMAKGYNSHGYADAIAKPYADLYANALYAEGWQTSELLKDVIANSEEVNDDDIVYFLATHDDDVPWERHLTLDGLTVLGETDASAEVRLDVTEHNNASKSRVGELAPRYLAVQDHHNVFDVTMTHQNGLWKVVSDVRRGL